MKIKLVDFVKLIDTCKSISELKIKCDLIYGASFEDILNKYLDNMNYKIDYEILSCLTLDTLAGILTMIAQNYERNHKFYISRNQNYENDKYTRYTDEYYLPDNFKFENISINI